MKIFFTFLFLFFLSSCLNPKGLYTRLPSVGSDFAPSDSDWLYIDLDVDAYDEAGVKAPYYEISTTEVYGDSATRESPSNCEIEYIPSEEGEGSESSPTIICIMDLMETDVTTKDLRLVYNVPEGMCEYFTVRLPWHFNYDILPGPIAAECTKESSGGGEGDEGEGASGFCDNRPGSRFACSQNICIEDKEELCPSDSGAPKCCYGGNKGDDEDWVPDEGCFGGPAMTTSNSEMAGSENLNVKFLQVVPEGGLRDSIVIQSFINLDLKTNTTAHFANYVKALDVSPPDKLERVGRRLPVFLQRDPDYGKAPGLFFEFRCINGADESLHEILFMIREWNTQEEFEVLYQSAGEKEGDPDIEGSEGDECYYENRPTVRRPIQFNVSASSSTRAVLSVYEDEEGAEPCNDMRDLEDFRNEYPRIDYGSSSDSD